jgi:hypothetical protein
MNAVLRVVVQVVFVVLGGGGGGGGGREGGERTFNKFEIVQSLANV